MKKIMQRFLGIAAAAALLVTYAVPVMATSSGGHTHKGGTKITDTSFSPKYTITLKQPDGVTIEDACYGAYQIFSGTVKGTMLDGSDIPEEPGDENKEIPITDIKWGNAFGDVNASAAGSGFSGKEKWQTNIVSFVYALATASDPDVNKEYAYAFKGFDEFKGFAKTEGDDIILDERFYFPSTSAVDKTDYDNVNFDKLAVEVAEVLSGKTDRQWLQMFADILGGYAQSTSGYAATGYVDRYYESETKTDGGETTYQITVPAGYYMIRDFSTIEEGEANSAFSARLLFVANNITQTLKSDVPTLKKNIIRDAVGTAAADPATEKIKEWETEAAGVGDVVTFQLTATLPSDYDNFLGGYTFKFEDTLPVGLTLNKNKNYTTETTNVDQYVSVKAKGFMETNEKTNTTTWKPDIEKEILTDSFVTEIVDETLTHHHFTDKTKDKTYTSTLTGNTLTVEFECLKEIVFKEGDIVYRLGYDTKTEQKSTIYVTYTTTVNYQAVVEPASSATIKNGNPNSAVLTYSDNPQAYADTDFTTAKSATIYTYGVDITKVDAAEFIKANGIKDADRVPLENVKFALVRENPDATDNNYQIAAFATTTVMSGYTPISGWNDLGTSTDDESLQEITKTYVETNSSPGLDSINCTVTSDSNGFIKISGLDDSVTYYLVEVETPPDGELYATIDPFTLTLTADIDGDEYTGRLATTGGVTVNHEITSTNPLSIDHFVQVINAGTADENGIAELIVANFKYVDLPSTGGTGTYIFYIVGGVVVAASLVLFFISRKKTTK